MIKLFQIVFSLSRPRFWIYLVGPYLIGSLAAPSDLHSTNITMFFAGFFIFLIPANIFLYGVNDMFDQETDLHNPKKNTHEIKTSEENVFIYRISVVISFLTLIIFSLFLNSSSRYILFFFLFLAFFYSAPPLRFKSKPILDFLSNILYAFPGFIAYASVTQAFPSVRTVEIIFLWTSAMHLFSAIPDIESDKKAQILTTAVWLGREKSLFLCAFFWSVFALHITNASWYLSIFIIYPLLPVLALVQDKISIEKIYWFFPYLNTFIGFVLFTYLLITHLVY